MKFLYKLFSIFLFFVILFFIKQIARDLSKNFENFEKSEKLENSQKSRKSVKESEIPTHEDIIVKKPGFVSEDVGDKKSEAIPDEASEDGTEDGNEEVDNRSEDKNFIPEDKPEDTFQEPIIEEKLFDDETGVRLLTKLEMEAIENRNCCRYLFMTHNL